MKGARTISNLEEEEEGEYYVLRGNMEKGGRGGIGIGDERRGREKMSRDREFL